MNNSDRHETDRRPAVELLDEHASELIRQIVDTYKAHVWENRYILHPRRLEQMGGEEIAAFAAYLGSLDPDIGIEQGRKRAEEGLVYTAFAGVGTLLREFYDRTLRTANEDVRRGTIRCVDEYMAACLRGYMEAREEQIRSDQEQLRIALSAALERRRRELFVKDHAIRTSINGILIAELDGSITYVNPAFLAIWGLGSEKEILSTNISDIFGREQSELIRSSLDQERGWQGELAFRRGDDESIEVAISASLILDENGSPVGIMSSVVDVTQRHHLEAQFRQAQKMEALGQLAGGIVHDFNNLLTAISGYAQLELMDLPKESAAYEDFLQIKNATDRGMDLTQELRMFTRQSSGGMEPLDANAVIEETVNILKRTFPPWIRIDLDLDPHLGAARANSSQVIQMLMNLCVNARDAVESKTSEQDGEAASGLTEGSIMIRTRNVALSAARAARHLGAEPGRYVSIEIRDSGVGMNPEIIDRLFEPFFTTKGEKRGTGLGLAVVYGIVQSHSGFIDVKSREGEGSTFSVFLPVSGETQPGVRAQAYSPGLASGRGTVLVADDDTQVQDMVFRALEKSGYSVILVDNGVAAVERYRSNRDEIDLVVLDMIMPRMGGRECLIHLREMDPRVLVLVMTGYTSDGSAEDLMELGAMGVIQKPFELQAFTKAVRTAVEGAEAGSAPRRRETS